MASIKHSFIIPHHNRESHLAVCLGSLMAAMGDEDEDYEVIIAGTIKQLPWSLDKSRIVFRETDPFAKTELGVNEPPPFHKTKLLNVALDAAHGKTITFLDADAVVGPKFRENLARLEDDTLTKLAYRVKYAAFTEWAVDAGKQWLWAFEHWDDLAGCSTAFEAYGTADNNCSRLDPLTDCAPWGKPFGNSHFSIRRDKLGDLRFDERYIGRGYDDIHFNRLIAEAHGDAYRCQIITDGPHALFNIKHPQSDCFCAGRWNERNRRLYYSDPRTFFVCPNCRTAERVKGHIDPRGTVVAWEPNVRWQLSEAIPGLDTIIHVKREEA